MEKQITLVIQKINTQLLNQYPIRNEKNYRIISIHAVHF